MDYITTTEEELIAKRFIYSLTNGIVMKGRVVNAQARVQTEALASIFISDKVDVSNVDISDVYLIKGSTVRVSRFDVAFVAVEGFTREDAIELIKIVNENPYIYSAYVNNGIYYIHKNGHKLSSEEEVNHLSSSEITEIVFSCSIGIWKIGAMRM